MVQFDQSFYLSQNPDVAAALEAGTLSSALDHFNLIGWKEGRDPSTVFDTSFYLEQNPDVAEAGVNPLEHFNLFGSNERRDPNPFFDTSFYLEQNPDVAEAGINPLEHFLVYGAGEGRMPNSNAQERLGNGGSSFDESAYLEAYGDVALAIANGDFTGGLEHYLLYGQMENRAAVDTGGIAIENTALNTDGPSVLGDREPETPVTPDPTVVVPNPPANLAPTAVVVTNVQSIAENADTTNRIKIADITVTDDGLGTNTLGLAGADAAKFEIDGTELFLKANTALDHETDPSFEVAVTVDDTTVGNTPDATSATATINVTDVNEAPAAVTLSNILPSIAEDTDTTNRIKVADITVTDDGLGTNDLAVTGNDAGLFEIVGMELFIKAGTDLTVADTARRLEVAVTVDDTAVGNTPDDTSATATINLIDEDGSINPIRSTAAGFNTVDGTNTDGSRTADGNNNFIVTSVTHINGGGNTIDGLGGNDTLNIEGFGTVDLRTAGTIAGIEALILSAAGALETDGNIDKDQFGSLTGSGRSDLFLIGGSSVDIGDFDGFDEINAESLADNQTLSIEDSTNGTDYKVTLILGDFRAENSTSTDSITVETIASPSKQTITTGAGDDEINAIHRSQHEIRTGSGNDTVDIEFDLTSADTLDGGAGIDTLNVSDDDDDHRVNDELNGVTNFEILNITNKNSTGYTLIDGTFSSDFTVNAKTASAVSFDASDEDDSAMTYNGNAGVDTVLGTELADTINGGSGADTLSGSFGADTIDGGLGMDTYVYFGSSESTVDNRAVPATGFDKVTVTAGDIFDFPGRVAGAKFDEITGVANPSDGNGDSLLNALNTVFQANEDSNAPREGMLIEFVDGTQYLVLDFEGTGQITDADFVVQIIGAASRLTVNFDNDIVIA
ncbi:hypothetical protein J7444_09790 [Labrenzia sp. R4_1]|uniref:hypothetical protein n=1 Tax=Labrenzia sp. R4_1 TaxID=2821106 RepID=UPI001ADCEFD1|nr:hypothetical protein [Labrenzia sp. R4_1]MBO9425011.1 hypothetical protein [Labrenzia sp. R4_1]